MNKTKRKIFETAMQLFADKGYEATSIEEITATVGVAKGTLYYHFSSKEEIFNFLVEEGMKLLKNSIQIKTDKVSSYIDKIRAIILIQIKIVAKYEDLPDIIVDIDNKLNHSVNLKVYDFNNPDMYNPLLTTIGCFLDRCQLDVRNDIIDRLIKLQTENETVKDYKVIDEDMLDEVRVSLNKDDEMER